LHCEVTIIVTLTQSGMNSFRGWCAGDLMLTKLRSSTLQRRLLQLTNLKTVSWINHTESVKDLQDSFGY